MRKHLCNEVRITGCIVVIAACVLANAACDIALPVDCSLDAYEGYWELTGDDRDGHDLDGLLTVFPAIGDLRLSIRTLRSFSSTGGSCFDNGSRVDCGSAVVPELHFFGSPSRDCGAQISLENSYRDIDGDVTVVATVIFTSTRTARVTVMAAPSRAWSPVRANLQRTD